MEHRRLGNTGLKVSAVSIGGWLTFGKSVDEEATRRISRAAIDGGVSFVDLADVYGPDGAAERTVGAILPDYRRSALVISSKVFWPTGEGPNDRGLSRKHIMESCERSLKRLGTDYIDLYFCHREDPETPLEETARAMDDLVRQGKILYWGTSCWSASTLLKTHALAGLRGLYAPVVEQPRYNLLRRDVERRVMPVAKRLGMGLVVWSPLASGALTGKYDEGVPEGSRGADHQMGRGVSLGREPPEDPPLQRHRARALLHPGPARVGVVPPPARSRQRHHRRHAAPSRSKTTSARST